MAMIDAQLRAKIRDLMTLGDLPNERPRVHQVGYVPPEIPPRSAVCLICGERAPMSPTSGVTAGRRTYMQPAMHSGSWNEDSG